MANSPLINKRAYAFYTVLETFDAGMVLTGAEVKSIRLGGVNFSGAYVSFLKDRPVILNLTISRYPKASAKNYNPKRPRQLLLRNREIKRLHGLRQQKGVTIIPLEIFFRNNFAKVKLGVVRGKRKKDRREALKKRALQRDLEVAIREKV